MSHSMKRFTLLLLALFMATLFLVACGGGEEPETADPVTDDTATEATTEEDVPEATEEPTEVPTEVPTEEPTPEPTEEPTPEPTPDITEGFTESSSEDGGFTISYPSDWIYEEAFGFAIIASDESLLEADEFGTEGAAGVIAGGTEEDMEIDPNDLEGSLVDGFAEDMGLLEAEIVEGPDQLTINDQDAARIVINAQEESGNLITSVIYVITSNGRASIFLGVSPEGNSEENIPLFDAIASTIVLSEPVASETGGDDEPFVIGGPDEEQVEGFLLFGDAVTGSVTEAGPSIWDFVGLAGESVDIFVAPSSDDLDVVVDVVDALGNSILSDGPVDNSFGEEEITGLEIVESGTFYIMVSGFDESDLGEYNLTFVEAGGEVTTENVGGVDTTPVSAGDIAYEETISGAITSEVASPAFAFTGSAGDIVSVVVDPEDEFDIEIDVVDSFGSSLLFAGWDNSFGTEITMLELPEDGEYSVVVNAYNEEETGSFELSLGGPGGSVIFADDTIEDAEEEHFFPFNGFEGEIVNIVVIPDGELDVIVTLFEDETDEELFTIDRSFGDEALGYIVPEDGNYYFSVTGFVADEENSEGGSGTGDYEVMLFGSDFVASETVSGDTVRGVFSPEDGIIEMTYGAVPGESVILTLEVAGDADGVIEVMDFDENILASVDDSGSGATETLTFVYEGEEESLVIIRVSEFFGLTGQFTLTVSIAE